MSRSDHWLCSACGSMMYPARLLKGYDKTGPEADRPTCALHGPRGSFRHIGTDRKQEYGSGIGRKYDDLKSWRVVLRLVGARDDLVDVEEEVEHFTHVAKNGGFIVEHVSVEQMADAEVIDGSPLDELLREGN